MPMSSFYKMRYLKLQRFLFPCAFTFYQEVLKKMEAVLERLRNGEKMEDVEEYCTNLCFSLKLPLEPKVNEISEDKIRIILMNFFIPNWYPQVLPQISVHCALLAKED